ncbi:zf-HC2 domain-containing protein [Catenuloplanes atrovinosus]|uniref:Anti-sigma factor RsiW n=1 Tax=Catenuloplanes atrovinosus TaxID=137266 RepID=A0AAE4CAR3_9ACTN|nr:zf-HC2 domain-containing protein [Catenuloplanes atrovinosus]MDR7277302.1 anti-sigma factor RsiW [Catenuloplanes atrovinosus]
MRDATCRDSVVRADLGFYVLDKLAAADSERVRRHTAACPACRDALDRLLDLLSLLAAAPKDLMAGLTAGGGGRPGTGVRPVRRRSAGPAPEAAAVADAVPADLALFHDQ